MIELLLTSLAVALTVPGIVAAIRALPPVEELVMAGVKPWACDICSCFWIAAIVTPIFAALDGSWQTLVAAGPGYTGALLILRLVQSPQSLPPPPEE